VHSTLDTSRENPGCSTPARQNPVRPDSSQVSRTLTSARFVGQPGDGTSEIRVLDAESFQEKRRLRVHDKATPIDQLNELEFVEGQIFANVWHSNRIARVSTHTGDVVGGLT
jgi:glutamine cyclotransferase